MSESARAIIARACLSVSKAAMHEESELRICANVSIELSSVWMRELHGAFTTSATPVERI